MGWPGGFLPKWAFLGWAHECMLATARVEEELNLLFEREPAELMVCFVSFFWVRCTTND